jgi:hypothetical protein
LRASPQVSPHICTVSQAYFALHKTLHKVQNFQKEKLIKAKVNPPPPHGASLLFRRFSAHEWPQLLGTASSALRSEFIPFQFIRKGKELNQLLALVDF